MSSLDNNEDDVEDDLDFSSWNKVSLSPEPHSKSLDLLSSSPREARSSSLFAMSGNADFEELLTYSPLVSSSKPPSLAGPPPLQLEGYPLNISLAERRKAFESTSPFRENSLSPSSPNSSCSSPPPPPPPRPSGSRPSPKKEEEEALPPPVQFPPFFSQPSRYHHPPHHRRSRLRATSDPFASSPLRPVQPLEVKPSPLRQVISLESTSIHKSPASVSRDVRGRVRRRSTSDSTEDIARPHDVFATNSFLFRDSPDDSSGRRSSILFMDTPPPVQQQHQQQQQQQREEQEEEETPLKRGPFLLRRSSSFTTLLSAQVSLFSNIKQKFRRKSVSNASLSPNVLLLQHSPEPSSFVLSDSHSVFEAPGGEASRTHPAQSVASSVVSDGSVPPITNSSLAPLVKHKGSLVQEESSEREDSLLEEEEGGEVTIEEDDDDDDIPDVSDSWEDLFMTIHAQAKNPVRRRFLFSALFASAPDFPMEAFTMQLTEFSAMEDRYLELEQWLFEFRGLYIAFPFCSVENQLRIQAVLGKQLLPSGQRRRRCQSCPPGLASSGPMICKFLLEMQSPPPQDVIAPRRSLSRQSSTPQLLLKRSSLSSSLTSLFSLTEVVKKQDPRLVAQQLFLVFYGETYNLLTFRSLRTLEGRKQSLHCQTLVRLFEVLSYWPVTEMLTDAKRTLSERIEDFGFFVNLAVESRKLGNYHAVFALVGGLQSPLLTWILDLATRKDKADFHSLKRLCRPDNNYKVYYADLSKRSSHLACVPYLGLLNRSLLSLQQDVPRFSSLGKINVLRIKRVWKEISNYLQYQHKECECVLEETIRSKLSQAMSRAVMDYRELNEMALAAKISFQKSARQRAFHRARILGHSIVGE